MNKATARWIVEQKRAYLLARRYGWLTVCVGQFVLMLPALVLFAGIILFKMPAYLWIAIVEWWDDEVRVIRNVDPLCWAKPRFRNAEDDAMLAECLATLKDPS